MQVDTYLLIFILVETDVQVYIKFCLSNAGIIFVYFKKCQYSGWTGRAFDELRGRRNRKWISKDVSCSNACCVTGARLILLACRTVLYTYLRKDCFRMFCKRRVKFDQRVATRFCFLLW